MSDRREFQIAECTYCDAVPTWIVYDNGTMESDWMLACDEHKTLPFS